MHITKDHYVFSMDKNLEPIAKVASGQRLQVDVWDCFKGSVQDEKDLISGIDFNEINPATGPIYVEGAQPGNVLKVTIHSIDLDPQGAIMTSPGLNKYFSNEITEEETAICKVSEDQKTFDYYGATFPVHKMIGVIGTAPKDEAVATGLPDLHGGNMDNNQITEGSVVYLPVEVEGALLALGDMHAAMGDGEIWGSGVEIGGSVDLTVEVLESFPCPTPFVETNQAYYSYGVGEDFETAVVQANDRMAEFLMAQTGLSYNKVGMFMTFSAHLESCQIVNPNISMRVRVDKASYEKLKDVKE
ncbi:acetamidase/formamidase family protein [Aerococcus urinae]